MIDFIKSKPHDEIRTFYLLFHSLLLFLQLRKHRPEADGKIFLMVKFLLAGKAEYTVENGVIVGRTVMNSRNTFLVLHYCLCKNYVTSPLLKSLNSLLIT
jgi:hypothetical protein